MYFEEITLLLENRLSPRIFSLKNDFYGIQYGDKQNKVIKKIMLTIDLTLNSIHFAVKNKINLIITLYGLFNSPITHLKGYHIKKLTLMDVQNQNKFHIEEEFLNFLQSELKEDKIQIFVQELSKYKEFEKYLDKWFEE